MNWNEKRIRLQEIAEKHGNGYIICALGWADILIQLNDELEKIVPEYRVLQIKEKFGILRVYIDHFSFSEENRKKAYAAITIAENKAEEVCEICGQPGSLVGTSWAKTYCAEHENEMKTEGFSEMVKKFYLANDVEWNYGW